MTWDILALLIMPVSGLIIGAVLLWVVSRDAAREDTQSPAE